MGKTRLQVSGASRVCSRALFLPKAKERVCQRCRS
jgi:hypothetical protein